MTGGPASVSRLLYHLVGFHEAEGLLPQREWFDSVLDKYFCKDCEKVDRRRYPEPIDITLDIIPRNMSVGEAHFAVLGVIHVRLLEVLLPYMTMGGFVFGRCFDHKGRLLEDYRTYYADRVINVRGAEGSSWGLCRRCGALWYHPRSLVYVLSRELDEHHLYQDAFCGLYVDQWLSENLDWPVFDDFSLSAIPVLDRPLDGFRLPGDPDWSSGGAFGHAGGQPDDRKGAQ
jgi:hypothetical protein